MRDYKWLVNIIGIVILVSAIWIGLKKVVLFILRCIGSILIAFSTAIISVIATLLILCIAFAILAPIGIYMGNAALSFIMIAFVIIVVIVLISLLGDL